MKHRIEYLIVRTLIAVVRVMPDTLVRQVGRTVGLAFHTFDRAHRRIAQRNLERAFPMRPAAERRAIARGTFEHFGRLLLELLKMFAWLRSDIALVLKQIHTRLMSRLQPTAWLWFWFS